MRMPVSWAAKPVSAAYRGIDKYLHRGAVFGTINRVSNARKILAGMRNNPRNWRIEDLEV